MKTYVFTNTDGEPIYTSTPSSDKDYVEGQVYSGYTCNSLPEGITEENLLSNYWYNGITWAWRGTQPSRFHKWNTTLTLWEDTRTLQDFKTQKWTEIKADRSQAEASGFNWNNSTFDSDAESQARINGAVTLALIAKQASQPYSITWTLADNTLRVLSADDMIAVGLALGTHVQNVFNKGQQLQQQIEAATTKEEIEAITWQI